MNNIIVKTIRTILLLSLPLSLAQGMDHERKSFSEKVASSFKNLVAPRAKEKTFPEVKAIYPITEETPQESLVIFLVSSKDLPVTFILHSLKTDMNTLSLLSQSFFKIAQYHTTYVKLRDFAKADILSTFPNLTHLNLCGNRMVLDKDLKKYTQLTQLNLAYNSAISDTGLKKLTNLMELNLINNKTITDKGIKNLTNLTKLYLTNETKITENGLAPLKNLTSVIRSNIPIADDYARFRISDRDQFRF